jgi:hypothetical protein
LNLSRSFRITETRTYKDSRTKTAPVTNEMNKIETNQNHFSQTDANLEEKNLSQSQHKPQQLLN